MSIYFNSERMPLAYSDASDKSVSSEPFLLKDFLKKNQEEGDFKEIGQAILLSDEKRFRLAIQSSTLDESFWLAEYESMNLVELSSFMIYYTHLTAKAESFEAQENILITLHKEYAAFLTNFPPKERYRLQAQMLFKSAEKCIKNSEFLNLGFSEAPNPNVKKVFETITRLYCPDCPYFLYVKQDNLETSPSMYQTNQRMYAEWCHITALGCFSLSRESPFDEVMLLGGRSRQLLAMISGSGDASSFGESRFEGREEPLSLITPLNDTKTPCYFPWYQKALKLSKSSFNYFIFAESPEKIKIKGTSFEEVLRADQSSVFCWIHGEEPELAGASKEWFELVVKHEEPAKVLEKIGKFYHTMIQYTPFKRGSATVSYEILVSLLLRYQENHPEFELPKAVTLLDCYALTMQVEDFLNSVFIPWVNGKKNDEDLLAILS